VFEAKAVKTRSVIKNNLSYKFKSAYFQCHNNYLLFSVLAIRSDINSHCHS